MLVNLISSFFLASAVLAQTHDDFRLARSSGHVNTVERDTNQYTSGDSAGAILDGALIQTGFDFVTGTFTVPSVIGPANSSAHVYLGIGDDGITSCRGRLIAGVTLSVDKNENASYIAWAQWNPDSSGFEAIQDFPVSTGDNIRVAVNVISRTSGTVTFENLTPGKIKTAVWEHNSIHTLCVSTAKWCIHSVVENDQPLPLAYFKGVTFTDSLAHRKGNETSYLIQDATPLIMVNPDNTVLAQVSMGLDRSSIDIILA